MQRKFRMMEKVHLLRNYTDYRTLTSIRAGAHLRTTGTLGVYHTLDSFGKKTGYGTEVFDPVFGTKIFVPTKLLAYPGEEEAMIEKSLLLSFPPETPVVLTEYYLEWGTKIGLPRGMKGKTTGIVRMYQMHIRYSMKSSLGVEVEIKDVGTICIPGDILRKIEEV